MLCALIAAVVVALDQISKAIVVAGLDIGEGAPFIPHVLSFCRSENTGMAWGLLKDHRWLFIAVSVLALVGFAVLYGKAKEPHILFTLSMGFIMGGGVGNMADRLFRPGVEVEGHAVVDFLKLEFVDFPIFNVADSFITVGAVLLAVYLLFFDRKREHALFFGRDGAGEADAGAGSENAGETGADEAGAGSADSDGAGADSAGSDEAGAGSAGSDRADAGSAGSDVTDAGGEDRHV